MRRLEEVMRETTVKRTRMTPELAEKLLEANTMNRSIQQSVVDTYARDMKAGRWTESNDAVVIGADGVLYNGQHRCWAVLQSGVAVWMLVMENAPEDSRKNMDTGRKRSAADNYEIATGEAGSRKLFETANSVRIIVTRALTASAGEKEEFLHRHRVGIDWAHGIYARDIQSLLRIAPVRAALAFAYETEPGKIDEFTQRLTTGVGQFEAGDPAIALQQSVSYSSRHSSSGRRALSVKTLRACLAYLRNERLSTVYATEDAVAYFGKKFGYNLKGSPKDLSLMRHKATGGEGKKKASR